VATLTSFAMEAGTKSVLEFRSTRRSCRSSDSTRMPHEARSTPGACVAATMAVRSRASSWAPVSGDRAGADAQPRNAEFRMQNADAAIPIRRVLPGFSILTSESVRYALATRTSYSLQRQPHHGLGARSAPKKTLREPADRSRGDGPGPPARLRAGVAVKGRSPLAGSPHRSLSSRRRARFRRPWPCPVRPSGSRIRPCPIVRRSQPPACLRRTAG